MCAPCLHPADVEMISNKMEKWFSFREFFCAPNSVTVSAGLILIDKRYSSGVISSNGSISSFILRVDDHTNLVNSGLRDFVYDYTQHGFLLTITVNQCLKRQIPLSLPRGCNNCLCNFHDMFLQLESVFRGAILVDWLFGCIISFDETIGSTEVVVNLRHLQSSTAPQHLNIQNNPLPCQIQPEHPFLANN